MERRDELSLFQNAKADFMRPIRQSLSDPAVGLISARAPWHFLMIERRIAPLFPDGVGESRKHPIFSWLRHCFGLSGCFGLRGCFGLSGCLGPRVSTGSIGLRVAGGLLAMVLSLAPPPVRGQSAVDQAGPDSASAGVPSGAAESSGSGGSSGTGQPIGADTPSEQDPAAPYRRRALQRWQEAIEGLEKQDASESHPDDAVLLLGSSSIRLWETADQQMAPYHVIRRGYGGARYSDLVVFARRLIEPHRFRAMVVFVGNDIAGSEEDATPEEIEPLVRQVVQIARAHQPKATIFLVEVTPTPKRFHLWPRIRRFNAMLREVALTESHTQFIATAERYLDQDDRPIATLFRDDQLHLSRSGYDIWSTLIRRRLADAGVGPPEAEIEVESVAPEQP